MSITVILGTPHRLREAGKQSPDGRLREAVYGREIVTEQKAKLEAYGIRTLIDLEALDLPKNMQTPNARIERKRELALRVNYVNEICRQQGAKNVVYVSEHVNASGMGDRWYGNDGWSVYVSPGASERSRQLADSLAAAAASHGLHVRQPAADRRYWEQSLYVLNRTLCPAVLTENLFQDNEKDVAFLLSDEGRHAIGRLHVEGIVEYVRRVDGQTS